MQPPDPNLQTAVANAHHVLAEGEQQLGNLEHHFNISPTTGQPISQDVNDFVQQQRAKINQIAADLNSGTLDPATAVQQARVISDATEHLIRTTAAMAGNLTNAEQGGMLEEAANIKNQLAFAAQQGSADVTSRLAGVLSGAAASGSAEARPNQLDGAESAAAKAAKDKGSFEPIDTKNPPGSLTLDQAQRYGRIPNPQSTQEAIQRLTSPDLDPRINAIIDHHLPAGATPAEKVSAIQSNKTLREDLGGYFRDKIDSNLDSMPWRIVEDSSKSPKTAGYTDGLTSRDYAAQLALSKLDGSFKKDAEEPVEIDPNGEVLTGQHRAAADKLLGSDIKGAQPFVSTPESVNSKETSTESGPSGLGPGGEVDKPLPKVQLAGPRHVFTESDFPAAEAESFESDPPKSNAADIGKATYSADDTSWAARISRGEPMPNVQLPGQRVVISAQDIGASSSPTIVADESKSKYEIGQKVRTVRNNGMIDDGWTITGQRDGKYVLQKVENGATLEKDASPADLDMLQKHPVGTILDRTGAVVRGPVPPVGRDDFNASEPNDGRNAKPMGRDPQTGQLWSQPRDAPKLTIAEKTRSAAERRLAADADLRKNLTIIADKALGQMEKANADPGKYGYTKQQVENNISDLQTAKSRLQGTSSPGDITVNDAMAQRVAKIDEINQAIGQLKGAKSDAASVGMTKSELNHKITLLEDQRDYLKSGLVKTSDVNVEKILSTPATESASGTSPADKAMAAKDRFGAYAKKLASHRVAGAAASGDAGDVKVATAVSKAETAAEAAQKAARTVAADETLGRVSRAQSILTSLGGPWLDPNTDLSAGKSPSEKQAKAADSGKTASDGKDKPTAEATTAAEPAVKSIAAEAASDTKTESGAIGAEAAAKASAEKGVSSAEAAGQSVGRIRSFFAQAGTAAWPQPTSELVSATKPVTVPDAKPEAAKAEAAKKAAGAESAASGGAGETAASSVSNPDYGRGAQTRLTSSFKPDDHVNVRLADGSVDHGWVVGGNDPSTGMVKVIKQVGDRLETKEVSAADLNELRFNPGESVWVGAGASAESGWQVQRDMGNGKVRVTKAVNGKTQVKDVSVKDLSDTNFGDTGARLGAAGTATAPTDTAQETAKPKAKATSAAGTDAKPSDNKVISGKRTVITDDHPGVDRPLEPNHINLRGGITDPKPSSRGLVINDDNPRVDQTSRVSLTGDNRRVSLDGNQSRMIASEGAAAAEGDAAAGAAGLSTAGRVLGGTGLAVTAAQGIDDLAHGKYTQAATNLGTTAAVTLAASRFGPEAGLVAMVAVPAAIDTKKGITKAAHQIAQGNVTGAYDSLNMIPANTAIDAGKAAYGLAHDALTAEAAGGAYSVNVAGVPVAMGDTHTPQDTLKALNLGMGPGWKEVDSKNGNVEFVRTLYDPQGKPAGSQVVTDGNFKMKTTGSGSPYQDPATQRRVAADAALNSKLFSQRTPLGVAAVSDPLHALGLTEKPKVKGLSKDQTLPKNVTTAQLSGWGWTEKNGVWTKGGNTLHIAANGQATYTNNASGHAIKQTVTVVEPKKTAAAPSAHTANHTAVHTHIEDKPAKHVVGSSNSETNAKVNHAEGMAGYMPSHTVHTTKTVYVPVTTTTTEYVKVPDYRAVTPQSQHADLMAKVRHSEGMEKEVIDGYHTEKRLVTTTTLQKEVVPENYTVPAGATTTTYTSVPAVPPPPPPPLEASSARPENWKSHSTTDLQNRQTGQKVIINGRTYNNVVVNTFKDGSKDIQQDGKTIGYVPGAGSTGTSAVKTPAAAPLQTTAAKPTGWQSHSAKDLKDRQTDQTVAIGGKKYENVTVNTFGDGTATYQQKGQIIGYGETPGKKADRPRPSTHTPTMVVDSSPNLVSEHGAGQGEIKIEHKPAATGAGYSPATVEKMPLTAKLAQSIVSAFHPSAGKTVITPLTRQPAADGYQLLPSDPLRAKDVRPARVETPAKKVTSAPLLVSEHGDAATLKPEAKKQPIPSSKSEKQTTAKNQTAFEAAVKKLAAQGGAADIVDLKQLDSGSSMLVSSAAPAASPFGGTPYAVNAASTLRVAPTQVALSGGDEAIRGGSALSMPKVRTGAADVPTATPRAAGPTEDNITTETERAMVHQTLEPATVRQAPTPSTSGADASWITKSGPVVETSAAKAAGQPTTMVSTPLQVIKPAPQPVPVTVANVGSVASGAVQGYDPTLSLPPTRITAAQALSGSASLTGDEFLHGGGAAASGSYTQPTTPSRVTSGPAFTLPSPKYNEVSAASSLTSFDTSSNIHRPGMGGIGL